MAKEPKPIGIVSNFFEHVGVIAVKLDGPLKVGDKIRVVGGELDSEEVVNSMQIHNKAVKEAKKGEDVGIKVGFKARRGYKVFKV